MNTRQQDIVTLVERHGEITIKELARRLGVSEMTVHRDLNYLQGEKYLCKRRGTAVFVEKMDRPQGKFYADEKRAIAKKTAALIQPGQSILFDNSSTVLECAKCLDGIPGLTFYTTNLETSMVLAACPDCVMYCSGGYYFADSTGFVGGQAEAFVAGIRADLCLIGASGISLEKGITNPYPMHTALQRKIIEASARRIVVADHSKFGRIAMEKAADLSEIDLIVTDRGLRPEILEEYRRRVPIVTP